MIEVPVVVSEWQQACCGRPFALEDRVEWMLMLDDAQAMYLPDAHAASLAVSAESLGDPWQGLFPTVVRKGDLRAYWRAPSRVDGHTHVRGVFFEEHHDGVPDPFEGIIGPTPGKILRIRAVWAPKDFHDEGRTRIYEPKRGPLDLREVGSSEDDAFGGLPRPAVNYLFDGWLVDLAVEDA